TLQPHDTDVKALTRLASVENIIFCCNRSTADHIITSPLFADPEYVHIPHDYSAYSKRFEGKNIADSAVERINKKQEFSEDNEDVTSLDD
ncbi:MAG: methylglyoxal synthase, partial [Bacteroidales bacterium]